MTLNNPETVGLIMDTETVEGCEPVAQGSGVDTDDWRAGAVCLRSNPETFFPEQSSSTAAAKTICATCSVIAQCLSYAIDNGERFGVWGGMTPTERQLLRPDAPSEKEANRRRRDRSVMELRRHGRNVVSIARTTGLNERTVYRIINRADEATQKGA